MTRQYRREEAKSPYEFFWDVPDGGFRWVQTKAMATQQTSSRIPGFNATRRHRFLTSGPMRGTETVRRYDPLTETGLFREFAGTEPTPDAFLRFANRYGPLGETYLIGVPDLDGKPPKGQKDVIVMRGDGLPIGHGEPFEAWAYESMRMRQVLDLWDWYRAEDLTELQRHIIWDRTARVGYVSHPDKPPVPPYIRTTDIIADSRSSPELLELFAPPDVSRPALFYIQRVVNDHLRGRVSPRLLWSRREGRPLLHLRPDNLIGALWLQFAQAIDGTKTYRQCPSCGIWFELSPELGVRRHRVYCSNACRTRAYRNRPRRRPQGANV
jgi:hypothetical protein